MRIVQETMQEDCKEFMKFADLNFSVEFLCHGISGMRVIFRQNSTNHHFKDIETNVYFYLSPSFSIEWRPKDIKINVRKALKEEDESKITCGNAILATSGEEVKLLNDRYSECDKCGATEEVRFFHISKSPKHICGHFCKKCRKEQLCANLSENYRKKLEKIMKEWEEDTKQ